LPWSLSLLTQLCGVDVGLYSCADGLRFLAVYNNNIGLYIPGTAKKNGHCPLSSKDVFHEVTRLRCGAILIYTTLLWSPYVIGQTIIFLPCDFFLLSFFLSSPNLSRRRLDVCHTSTHGVALVRI